MFEFYDDVIGAIFPYFHVASTLQAIRDGRHLNDRSWYCSLMACCALASAKARDGCALIVSPPKIPEEYTPEYFFEQSLQQLPNLTSSEIDFHHLRACFVLSHSAVQNGRQALARRLACEFHSLSDLYGLHDESNWPDSLSAEEKEEHRSEFH